MKENYEKTSWYKKLITDVLYFIRKSLKHYANVSFKKHNQHILRQNETENENKIHSIGGFKYDKTFNCLSLFWNLHYAKM